VPRHSSSATFARRVQLTVVAGEGPSVQLGTAKLPARSVARSTTHGVAPAPTDTACGQSIVAIATRVPTNR